MDKKSDHLQIIDEIDGALGEGKGAVEVIMKMVSNTSSANFTSFMHGRIQINSFLFCSILHDQL